MSEELDRLHDRMSRACVGPIHDWMNAELKRGTEPSLIATAVCSLCASSIGTVVDNASAPGQRAQNIADMLDRIRKRLAEALT